MDPTLPRNDGAAQVVGVEGSISEQHAQDRSRRRGGRRGLQRLWSGGGRSVVGGRSIFGGPPNANPDDSPEPHFLTDGCPGAGPGPNESRGQRNMGTVWRNSGPGRRLLHRSRGLALHLQGPHVWVVDE